MDAAKRVCAWCEEEFDPKDEHAKPASDPVCCCQVCFDLLCEDQEEEARGPSTPLPNGEEDTHV